LPLVFYCCKSLKHYKKKEKDPKNKEVSTPKNIELMNKTNELLEKQNHYLRQLIKKED